MPLRSSLLYNWNQVCYHIRCTDPGDILFPQESCASRLCASSQDSDYPLEKTLNSCPIKSEREALLVGKEANTHIQRIECSGVGGRINLRCISTCQAFMKHDSARTQSPEDNRVRTSTDFNQNGNSGSQPSSNSWWPLPHPVCQYKCYAKRGSTGETRCRFFKSLSKDRWALSLPLKGQCRHCLAESFSRWASGEGVCLSPVFPGYWQATQEAVCGVLDPGGLWWDKCYNCSRYIKIFSQRQDSISG